MYFFAVFSVRMVRGAPQPLKNVENIVPEWIWQKSWRSLVLGQNSEIPLFSLRIPFNCFFFFFLIFQRLYWISSSFPYHVRRVIIDWSGRRYSKITLFISFLFDAIHYFAPNSIFNLKFEFQISYLNYFVRLNRTWFDV